MNSPAIPKSIPIKKVIEENASTKTFIFDYKLDAKPGQFVMAWLPGVDQNPLSIAWEDENGFAITVCAVGDFSKALCEKKKGDLVGITGPFGTNYKWDKGDHLALVVGGYGVAPMYYVALKALEDDCKIEFLLGARTEELVLYRDYLKKLPNVTTHFATNDGSCGRKCYVTDILKELIAKEKINRIFTCGPELMMKVVSDIAFNAKIPAQLSVERFMKCGFGICGQCCVDKLGIRACKQGPVMDNSLVRQLEEFGQYHRDSVGRKIQFTESR